jgi:hypothetical protein
VGMARQHAALLGIIVYAFVDDVTRLLRQGNVRIAAFANPPCSMTKLAI